MIQTSQGFKRIVNESVNKKEFDSKITELLKPYVEDSANVVSENCPIDGEYLIIEKQSCGGASNDKYIFVIPTPNQITLLGNSGTVLKSITL